MLFYWKNAIENQGLAIFLAGTAGVVRISTIALVAIGTGFAMTSIGFPISTFGAAYLTAFSLATILATIKIATILSDKPQLGSPSTSPT